MHEGANHPPRSTPPSENIDAGDITRLLHDWKSGDCAADAGNDLFEAVYATLRSMAAARMASARADAVLQPTVLVHEALLRMLGNEVEYSDRVHFFALAALKMRAVLVDHARAALAQKRGAGAVMVTLSHVDEANIGGQPQTMEYQVLALHEALERFAVLDPRAARAVELSYFGGLSQGEIADVLGVSLPTVERDLRIARAWLKRRLQDGAA